MIEETRLSWDSSRVLEVKNEWESLWNTYTKTPEKISDNPRDTYATLVRMQADLLRKKLSDDDVRKLTASCRTLPKHWRDWSPFEQAVVGFMLDVFVHAKDRESLVTLLSTRLPLRVGNWPIEYYLARQQRLNDPILILGEAYSKCRVPEVRHDIAAAVRRGFGGHGITGKDDTEFVNNAMQWYRSQKENLVLDTVYCDDCLPLEPEEAPAGQYEEIWSHRQHSLYVIRR